MSQENLEIVRRMYGAFHCGDADAALSCFDPDVAVDASRRVDGGIGCGRDELRAIIGRWLGTFEEWSEELEEIRDLGHLVYVGSMQRSRGWGSDQHAKTRIAVLYEVEGGQITRITMFPRPSEARAAGRSE